MLDSFDDRLEMGARNLLINCANCQPEQKLLIVYETENDHYFDPELAFGIEQVGRQLGLETEMFGVPLHRDVCDPDAVLAAKMEAAACTVFLARLGDQIRFRPQHASMNQIVSYVLDREMLASPFGMIDYQAFESLNTLINQAVSDAAEIHVTCPAGTDFKG
ncbi:hypothetical protein N9M66_07075, partial [Litoreibacter sp.]|nr:hypothetical protein [Litoreibacter sp.]